MEKTNQLQTFASLDENKIELIKRTICKGATDDELQLFIHACNRTKLDPFMKQIYAVKRGGTMTIQTGIDGYRLIAERTGRYMPGREPSFVYDDKGRLLSATSYVKKMDSNGQWHEIAATAHFSEYNANGNMWQKLPHAMLAKCSESLALRKAFPADLSGLNTEEEMEQASKEEDVELSIDASAPKPLTQPQINELKRAAQAKEVWEKVLKEFNVQKAEDIGDSRFKEAWVFAQKEAKEWRNTPEVQND